MMTPLGSPGSSEKNHNTPLIARGSSEKSNGTPCEDSVSSETARKTQFYCPVPDCFTTKENHPALRELGIREFVVIQAELIEVKRDQTEEQGKKKKKQGPTENKTVATMLKILAPACLKNRLIAEVNCWIKCEGPSGLVVKNPETEAVNHVDCLDGTSEPNGLTDVQYVEYFASKLPQTGFYLPKPDRDFWDDYERYKPKTKHVHTVHPFIKRITKLDEEVELKEEKEELKKLTFEKFKLASKRERIAQKIHLTDIKELKGYFEKQLADLEKQKEISTFISGFFPGKAPFASLPDRITAAKKELMAAVTELSKLINEKEDLAKGNTTLMMELLNKQIREIDFKIAWLVEITDALRGELKSSFSFSKENKYKSREKVMIEKMQIEIRDLDTLKIKLMKAGTKPEKTLVKLQLSHLAQISNLKNNIRDLEKELVSLERGIVMHHKIVLNYDLSIKEIREKLARLEKGNYSEAQKDLLNRLDSPLKFLNSLIDKKTRQCTELEELVKEKRKLQGAIGESNKGEIARGSLVVQAGRLSVQDLELPSAKQAGVSQRNLHNFLKILNPPFLKDEVICQSDWIPCEGSYRRLTVRAYWEELKKLDPKQATPSGRNITKF